MKYLKVMFKAKSGTSDFEYKIGEVNIANNWNPDTLDPKEMGGCAVRGYMQTAIKIFEDKVNSDNIDLAFSEFKDFCKPKYVDKFDDILKDNGKISRKQAEEKAGKENDEFNKNQKIVSDFDKLIIEANRLNNKM